MSNSVKIPVSADASRAVAEMERFTSAIRKTGQEGMKFADLDFSHPEMKDLASQMIEAQRRFDEIVKVGRGAAAKQLRSGVQAGHYQDVSSWWEGVPAQFPNKKLRDKHITDITHGMFFDTEYQPRINTPQQEPRRTDPRADTGTDRPSKNKNPSQISIFDSPGVEPGQAKMGQGIETAGVGARMRWGLTDVDRFTAALRKAGQEGRKFEELDFSHPEMSELNEELIAAKQRFDELVRSGRGERAKELTSGIKKGHYDDFTSWLSGTSKQFPKPILRQQHMQGVLNAMGGGPGSGSGGPSSPGGMGGILGGGAGALMRFALPLLGIAGVGKMAAEGISSATDEAVEIGQLRRQLVGISSDFEYLRDNVRQAGDSFGLTYQETVRMARSFARASGEIHDKAVFGGTREAVDFARALGLDPSQTVGRFGRAQWLQAGGRDSDPREIADIFAGAISAGGMFAKGDEVMDAIINWIDTSQRTMVSTPNVSGYASLQAGMNASGIPGLRGQAGAAMMAQMDAALRGGGGAGEAGRNMLHNLFAGVGVRDPFKVQYALEGGAFERIGGDGPMLYQSVMDRVGEVYPDDESRWDAMSNILGITMRQAEALEKINPADLTATDRTLAGMGYDTSTMGNEQRINLARVMGMGGDELRDYRTQLLRTRGGEIGTEQSDTLRGETDTDKLREQLLQITAQLAPEKDTGQRALEAQVAIKNELTKLGTSAVELLTDIKFGIAKAFNITELLNTPRTSADDFIKGGEAPGVAGASEEMMLHEIGVQRRKEKHAQARAIMEKEMRDESYDTAINSEANRNQHPADVVGREYLRRQYGKDVAAQYQPLTPKERGNMSDTESAALSLANVMEHGRREIQEAKRDRIRESRIPQGQLPGAQAGNQVEVAGSLEATVHLVDQHGQPAGTVQQSVPLRQPQAGR